MITTLPRPSSTPCSCGVPLADLARALHPAQAPSEPSLLAVAEAPDQELELAIGPVPAGPGHPAEALVGFRVAPRWWAVGLLAAGHVRPLGQVQEPGGPDPALLGPAGVTTLAARDGHVACVLGTAQGPVVLDREPPVGWVADVMARVFGRPTPPPSIGVAAWVEAVWLDRVAVGVLGHPARQPTWAWIAERHPLRGTGPTPTPAQLARRTIEHEQTQPWSEILRRWPGSVPLPGRGLPGWLGHEVSPADWFDEGSLSRWVLRSLPPAEQLLDDLLEVLPSAIGRALTEGRAGAPTGVVDQASAARR